MRSRLVLIGLERCTWCDLPPYHWTSYWPIGPLLSRKPNHSCQFEHEVCIRKIKTKEYWKIPEFYPVKAKKRENLGKIQSTGEPDAVKWFRKKVSLIRKILFIFSKYIMIEMVTVSAVKGWNREKTITTLGTAASVWKKQWAVGESITRNTR